MLQSVLLFGVMEMATLLLTCIKAYDSIGVIIVQYMSYPSLLDQWDL